MKTELDNVTCSVALGALVPDFKLETWDPAVGAFGEISLAELRQRGRWTLLIFYPADFTFVCPTELADVAALHEQFRELGAEVISVSTDTKYAHLAWQRDEKLLEKVRFPMAADPTGNVASLFGVYDEATGLALRGTFVISPEGKLTASEINLYNVGRSAAELLRKVKANVYLSKHPEEACPANWDEGGKTLTPGKDLVGKVFDAL